MHTLITVSESMHEMVGSKCILCTLTFEPVYSTVF
jgi:hypothetical protein